MKIAIVSSNRLYTAALSAILFPLSLQADTVLYRKAADALAGLKARPVELSVMDPHTSDLDGLDYIPDVIASGFSERNLIISNRYDERTLVVLSALRYDGWVDAGAAGSLELESIISAITDRRRCLSPTLTKAIGALRTRTDMHLTPHEEKILSVLGSGSDDLAVAGRLNLSADTVRTHRSRIMKKLGLHQKGDLMTYAVQHGYIRFTPERILHPGFDRLLASIG